MTHVIAHRGASRLERENTVQACRRAVAVGADGIELDVRRSADGVLVCHHDARLADGRAIGASTHAMLPAYVPTLDDALDACRGVWVNVELKNDAADPDFDAADTVADDVLAVLAARSEPASNWLISSFRLATIDRCRDLDPSFDTALLTHGVEDGLAERLVAAGHIAVHPWDPTVDASTIERCHDVGLQVNAWTCNEPDRFAELVAWGIDGICTDIPEVMVNSREERPTPA